MQIWRVDFKFFGSEWGIFLAVLISLCGCAHRQTVLMKEPEASNRFLGADRAEVKKVIAKHNKEIKDCYFDQLVKNPEPSGRIVMQFEIGDYGKVSRVQMLSSTFKTSDVQACLVDHLKTWKFATPLIGDTAIVSYPFEFKAEE